MFQTFDSAIEVNIPEIRKLFDETYEDDEIVL